MKRKSNNVRLNRTNISGRNLKNLKSFRNPKHQGIQANKNNSKRDENNFRIKRKVKQRNTEENSQKGYNAKASQKR